MRRTAALAVLPAVLLAVLPALLLAGCSSAELSDLQLRKRASAICATAARRAGRIATPQATSGTAAFIKAGIAVLDREHVALNRLRPPHDLRTTYRTSVEDLERQLDDLRLAVHSLASGEDPVIAIKTLQHRLTPLEQVAAKDWSSLQTPACASQLS